GPIIPYTTLFRSERERRGTRCCPAVAGLGQTRRTGTGPRRSRSHLRRGGRRVDDYGFRTKLLITVGSVSFCRHVGADRGLGVRGGDGIAVGSDPFRCRLPEQHADACRPPGFALALADPRPQPGRTGRGRTLAGTRSWSAGLPKRRGARWVAHDTRLHRTTAGTGGSPARRPAAGVAGAVRRASGRAPDPHRGC